MSKEEFLKIQTCVLKVNIHCDGCKNKVKKILQKVEGVYTVKIDSEQGKVTVSGNVDPVKLIKKLDKSGKHAEIWGSKPSNNNQTQMNNQFKNVQIGNEKGGNNKNQKGGGGGGGQANNNAQSFQQQLQKMKGFPDMKLPNVKDMKMPFKNPNQNQNQNQNNHKGVKFNLPDDEDDMSDGDYDDDDDDFDDEDDYEDDMHHQHHPPPNKMNPAMKNGANAMMMMMNGLNPHSMNPQANKNSGNCGPMNGANDKKGGGGNVPIQTNGKGGGGVNEGKNGNGGKKGGGWNGNTNGGNQNQGGGATKNGGKNGGIDAKNGNPGGAGGGNKNRNNGGGVNGGNGNGNGARKGGAQPTNNLPFGFQNTGQMGSNMSNMPMGQMGQFGNMPRGVPFGNMPTVQGLPPSAMNGGSGGGYFPGAGPGGINGDPAYQHQMAAAMMNQQRAMGNERFQPMMYARPPPAVNYMPPPYPYPHPYQHPQAAPHPPHGNGYTHMFSDENTSSCNVM